MTARPRGITSSSGDDTSPDWSPDGHRIVFVSDCHGNPEVHTMEADGSDVRRLAASAGHDDFPAWASNVRVWGGTDIAFTSGRGDNFDIYVMGEDGSGARRLTTDPADDLDPAWSPDGRLWPS